MTLRLRTFIKYPKHYGDGLALTGWQLKFLSYLDSAIVSKMKGI